MAQANDRSGHSVLGRRTILAGLAAVPLAAGGCTADPRIGGTQPTSSARPTGHATGRATPAPSPTPTPSFVDSGPGAGSERKLAATALGIGRRWRDDLDQDRSLLDKIARAHLVHADALTSADPTSRAVAPGSSPTPTASSRKPRQDDLEDALGDLVRAERATATAHRQRALAATGFSALLWASMGAAATAYAATLEILREDDPATDLPSLAKTPERHALPLLSDTEAVQDLVRQLHAIAYGYQVAIGQLDSGVSKDRALARLQALRRLRNTLIAQLRARTATVPVAAPAYVPSLDPTSATKAALLIRRMERALTPYVGLWLAAAPQPQDRAAAYGALLATDAAARSFGAGPLTWPGWNG